jgi:hypothetical protein
MAVDSTARQGGRLAVRPEEHAALVDGRPMTAFYILFTPAPRLVNKLLSRR